MLRIIKFALALFAFIIFSNFMAYAQDATWQQVLDGWVDDVYYENLFLGGSYYTRISLADIDGDGDLDMFYGGGDCGSLVYFENIGNTMQPVFELRNEEYPSFRHPTRYGGTADVDFADLDNDGDLDAAFDFRLDGGGLIFINTGTPDEPSFTFYPYGTPQGGVGNSTFADIDGDGDYDYFSGNGRNGTQLHFAENTGTPDSAFFVTMTHHYQNLDLGTSFNFDMGDIDSDGDYDIIVCKRGGNVAFYENIGTITNPNFVLETNNLLPNRDTTDWMETPELVDFDNDGDLDLFLAGSYAHLFYFENISDSEELEFLYVSDTSYFYVFPHTGGALLSNSVDIDSDGDDDIIPGNTLLLNESANGVIRFSRINNAVPFVTGAFADLDADGDFDYIIPAPHTLGYYENIGDSLWPIWSSYRQLFPPDGRLYYVYSVTAGDINNDGDIDLLVGHEGSQRPDYYRNDGTPQVYDFVFADELLLPQWEFRGIYDLLLEDLDQDNDLDLFIGDSRSPYHPNVPIRFIYYRNDGTPVQPSWVFVTDDFENVISLHRNGSITLSFADVDKDGDRDLILTNNAIGLQLFLNPEIQTDIWDYNSEASTLPREPFIIQCYPNPSNSTILFSIKVINDSFISIDIVDILGRSVDKLFTGYQSSGVVTYTLDVTGFISGIYFLRASNRSRSYYSKFTVLK